MPTGIFPFIGSYGSSETDKFDELFDEYGNNEYDGYTRGAAIATHGNIIIKAVRKATITSIRTFWRMHKSATTKAAKEFYYYSPLEASQSDIDGDTGIGKYIAVFAANEVTWTREGRCRFSAIIPIKILSEA